MTLLSVLDLPIVAAVLRLILIAALTALAIVALEFIASQVVRHLARLIRDVEQVERAQTIIQVARGALVVLALAIAVLTALQTLGVNTGPLLTGMGIVGLALTLGAQTLIKDYLGGLLILIENQFAIGDVIQVAGVQGEVERITLRATYLRDLEGKFHIVPNGDIRLVSNLTMEWSRAVVDLNLDIQTDMEHAIRTLDKAARQARVDEAVRADLIGPPQVLGWFGFKDGGIQARLTAKTRPGRQWQVAMALRRYAIEALQTEGIKVLLPS